MKRDDVEGAHLSEQGGHTWYHPQPTLFTCPPSVHHHPQNLSSSALLTSTGQERTACTLSSGRLVLSKYFYI